MFLEKNSKNLSTFSKKLFLPLIEPPDFFLLKAPFFVFQNKPRLTDRQTFLTSFFSFLQASRENWLLDLGDYRKRTWWYGTTISKAAIKWGVNINGPFYSFSKTVHKTFILLFYFLKICKFYLLRRNFKEIQALIIG